MLVLIMVRDMDDFGVLLGVCGLVLFWITCILRVSVAHLLLLSQQKVHWR